ncbi:hypothetical protein [uncultured Oscillibacter sp.]|uniref:hypothetical protein n=1 Tax=uncultured Oscillibacter sp. TaxID=876091 RepID=UPI0025CCDF3B|nr:hypothetical protein [uncultured Oscillibacter sp.]
MGGAATGDKSSRASMDGTEKTGGGTSSHGDQRTDKNTAPFFSGSGALCKVDSPFSLLCFCMLLLREDILIKIKSYDGFSTFMKTCFPNIIFSEDIETGMRGITHFETVDVRKAIIHDLGVLNDEALEIYREYAPNTEKMCKVLGSKVLACSMDTSDHNQFLSFSFSYLHDNQDIQIKSVLCSPHTKLLRRDSNLRIYFSWKDSIVGKGEKVLVGHIGGHPY